MDTLFRQAGIIRAEPLDEWCDVASLLPTQPLPEGNRAAIVTNAGGPGILAADARETNGLVLASLTAATLAALRGFLPAAGLGNPIDMIASTGERDRPQPGEGVRAG